jgi:hypothetical protein
LLLAAFAGALVACTGSGHGSSGGGGPGTPPQIGPFGSFQAAAVVIGQPDFTSANWVDPLSTTTRFTFGEPALIGSTLYLPDYDNHRVLEFFGIPTTNGVAADLVLGQPDLTTGALGMVGASVIGGPQTVFSWNGKLLVDDFTYDRIMVWDSASVSSVAPAGYAIGQTGLDVDVMACTSVNLTAPESFYIAGGKLLVSDSGNNRVLIWNSVPTTSGVPADLVLGQPSMTDCAANDPFGAATTTRAVTASTMFYPSGIWSDGTRIVVSDSSNNRVLIWTAFPTTNGHPADLVLGQTSFTSSVADDPVNVSTPAGLSHPYLLDSDGTQLFVADTDNNRVLLWHTFPSASGAMADDLLGQWSFTATAANDDNQDGIPDANPSARTLDHPSGVKLIGTQLFVADRGNSRYLIFNGH